MIGFEIFIMVNFFSENSTIKHLTLAYGVSLVMIALVQNDFVPITFSVFRVIIVFVLILLLVFYMRLPANKKACPKYIKRSDNFAAPKKLITGTFILAFISALMAVSGPAISGEAEHGVFITYMFDAIASFIIYVLYKKASVHPFFSISICIALGSLGFLAMYIANEIPWVAYISSALIGIGINADEILSFKISLTCKYIPCSCSSICTEYNG